MSDQKNIITIYKGDDPRKLNLILKAFDREGINYYVSPPHAKGSSETPRFGISLFYYLYNQIVKGYSPVAGGFEIKVLQADETMAREVMISELDPIKKKSPENVKKMNPVVHFEMPYEDSKRIATFYSKAFGWQTQALGAEMGNYVLATTTESEAIGKTSNRPKMAGTINGGFYPKTNDMPAQFPSVVIAVEDIEQAMAKVEAAGGEVLGEPMEIPGVGTYVSFFDTEGNRVSMMQPLMK